MSIPSRKQCLALMEHIGMPAHIQKHSIMVAEVAVYLGCLLNRNSTRLNLPLVEASALLHDLGKSESLKTGEKHEEVGARMLRERGYFLLAPIVQEHVSMDPEWLKGPISESLLVNYADKRVKHDEIVSVEERFYDLGMRYGRTKERKAAILDRLQLYLILEKRIFGHLTVAPADVGSVSVSSETCLRIGSEDYERQEIDSSTVGGRKIGGT
jgi:uncharacterized protein